MSSESSRNNDSLTLRDRWGAVTVLIEQKDVLSTAAARRTSLTPSLVAPSSDGTAPEQPWNSRASTTSNSSPSLHHSTSVAAAATNRRQRTSTTMHASLDVPHSLVLGLSSQAIVQIQPQLLPLPAARPLVLLVQLEDYIPQELSTTPSSVCFPPNATPTPQSIQRALAPLYTVIARLQAAKANEGVDLKQEVAIMLYSENVHLPDEIAIAAFKSGAHGLLCPPFTPDSVKRAVSSALERHAYMHSTRPPHSLSELAPDHHSDNAEQESHETPQPAFQAPFTSSAPVDHHLRASRRQAPEIQSHEREGFSPMDTSHPILDSAPHLSLADSLGARGFPHLAGVTERRASVDLGGLALSINSFTRSSDSMAFDSAPRELDWRATTGSGWAGWDTAPQGSSPFGEQRDTITATTSKRRKSVPAFDEGGELEHANLVLSMHLHSIAALENATLASFAPNGNSMRHQQTLSNSSAFTSSPSASPLSQHYPEGVPFSVTNAGYQLQPLSAKVDPGRAPSPSPPSHSPNGPLQLVPPSPRNATRLLNLLSSWHFEPFLLSPNDAANCVILMFSTLLSAFKVSPLTTSPISESAASGNTRIPLASLGSIRVKEDIAPFVQSLQRLYRKENRYHSFVHALDVLQAVWTFLKNEGRVPLLEEQDVQAQADWEVSVDGAWRVRAASRFNAGYDGAESKKKRGPSALSLLNDAELFVLCLAAIGHDVGHPGNGNAFLKNAQTPLSKLYEDKSALEKMHCTLLLRLLKKYGMEHLITTQTPEGREGRRLVVGTVLATDMSWHFQWLEGFQRAMKERKTRTRYALQMQQAATSAARGNTTSTTAQTLDGGGDDASSETHTDEAPELVLNPSGNGTWTVEPDTEENRRRASLVPPPQGDVGGENEDGGEGLFRSPEIADREDRMFLCQAIMKCADISNPCRPHHISRHWSTVLLEEWAAQALLERHLGLPVSVAADANEKVQCVGQISFIKLFTQPLFDAVSAVLDGLSPIAKDCAENRVLWERRLATFDPPPDSAPADDTAPNSPTTHVSQMIRPIPLALPILPPMARYAKTVFPLSFPRRKKAPLETRRLASMSPWHAVAVPMASGSKVAAGGGRRFHTANGSTANTSTSTATNASSGTSRMWSRSRPESVSSTSTLSSLPGSNSSRGGGDMKGDLPRTPTNANSMMQPGQMRSPISPLLSPFSTSNMGLPFSFGGYSVGDTNIGETQAFVPSSVWDVDREVKQRCRSTLHHAWEHRDGRKAQNSLLLEMLGLDGSDPPNGFRARRSSFG